MVRESVFREERRGSAGPPQAKRAPSYRDNFCQVDLRLGSISSERVVFSLSSGVPWPPCRVCCCSEPCMLKCLDTLWRDVHCFCTRDPSLGCAPPSRNVLRDRRRAADSLDTGRYTACPSAIMSHPQPNIRVTRYIFAKSSSSFTLTTHAVPNHTFFE